MDELREGIINEETKADNLPQENNEEQSSKTVGKALSEVVTDEWLQNEQVEREFQPIQTVFAYVCWLVGYLLCRIYPVMSSPFGGLLLIVGLFTVTAVFLKRQGATFGKMSVISAVLSIAVSLGLLLSSNGTLHTVSYMFALCGFVYFVYSAMGNTLQKGFSDYVLADFIKALFVLPFCNFGLMFKAMFSGKARNGGKVFGKTVLGLVIAFVPTIIVVVLLSYDEGFSEILESIFDFRFVDVFLHLFSLGIGIPIGMYLFGLFLSSVDGDIAKGFNAENTSKVSKAVQKLPTVTALAASLPLLLVYVVFFISQWKYYISGFTGVLPDDISYANYAREGFFQLCTVSVINFIAIIVLSVFMRRNDNGKSLVLKALSVLFSVFTLILISTAIAKMVMYIGEFGLTPKRVYASWFMIVLAVVFILVILKQFITKFKVIIASVGVCVVLFAALSLLNVDGFIAKYNVDRYLDKSLKTVDVEALYDLGDAAIPEMVRLAQELDKNLGTDISKAIDENKELDSFLNSEELVYISLTVHLKRSSIRIETENTGLFAFTVQRYRAEKALDSINAFD